MAKCKEVALAIGLVFITTLSWFASSCSQTITSAVSVVIPKDDNLTPGTPSTSTGPLTKTPTTIPPPAALTPSTSVETPTTTAPPATLPPTTPTENSTNSPSIYDVNINNYSLNITGNVNGPSSLSYAQILAYPAVTEKVEIVCPDEEDEIDDWTGVPVATLLKQAGLTPEAGEVIFTGIDGYHIELPLEFILSNDVFLAYQMNGQTLSQDRGYPLRLVVKGNIGAYWPRWVTKIEVKSALVSFSNPSTIIRDLRTNIPTAGSRLCSCLLTSIRALSKSINQSNL